MKWNGTTKQAIWAEKILANAKLTSDQVDALLWYAGPTLHEAGVMDVTIVIDNRNQLAKYADSLIKLRSMPQAKRSRVAQAAANSVQKIAERMIENL